ncbi:hypothetical protein HW555_002495 [Spodoptera exigua]|uniref:Uncharacterized protein n=1 Tax=Spodoptera exigua TaxID=7107 RepID=A0A835L7V9_SPOEX|nr:hypothetical protein HW555_002495 [Spodoptera exigua]
MQKRGCRGAYAAGGAQPPQPQPRAAAGPPPGPPGPPGPPAYLLKRPDPIQPNWTSSCSRSQQPNNLVYAVTDGCGGGGCAGGGWARAPASGCCGRRTSRTYALKWTRPRMHNAAAVWHFIFVRIFAMIVIIHGVYDTLVRVSNKCASRAASLASARSTGRSKIPADIFDIDIAAEGNPSSTEPASLRQWISQSHTPVFAATAPFFASVTTSITATFSGAAFTTEFITPLAIVLIIAVSHYY